MKSIRTVTATLTLAFASFSASSEPREGPFEKMDRDGDGMISLEEFRPPRDRMAQRLRRADENGDGEVSLDEIEGARAARQAKAEEHMRQRQKRRDQFFSSADEDQNGSLSAEEIRQGMFTRLDENGDGQLSKKELAQLRAMARRGPKGERPRFRRSEAHQNEMEHDQPLDQD